MRDDSNKRSALDTCLFQFMACCIKVGEILRLGRKSDAKKIDMQKKLHNQREVKAQNSSGTNANDDVVTLNEGEKAMYAMTTSPTTPPAFSPPEGSDGEVQRHPSEVGDLSSRQPAASTNSCVADVCSVVGLHFHCRYLEAVVGSQSMNVWSMLMPAVYQLVPGAMVARMWFNSLFPPPLKEQASVISAFVNGVRALRKISSVKLLD